MQLKSGLQIAPNWPEIGKITVTSQFPDMTSSSHFFNVVRSILYGCLVHFSAQAQKIKKSTPKKISYVSGNGNLEKVSYIFLKESFYYFSRNGNLEKNPYISGNGNPIKPNLKKLLIF